MRKWSGWDRNTEIFINRNGSVHIVRNLVGRLWAGINLAHAQLVHGTKGVPVLITCYSWNISARLGPMRSGGEPLLEAIDTRMILYGFGIGFPISFPGTPMVFDVLMCAINPFWEPAKCVYKFFGV